jgi:hypothetical protein
MSLRDSGNCKIAEMPKNPNWKEARKHSAVSDQPKQEGKKSAKNAVPAGHEPKARKKSGQQLAQNGVVLLH